MERFASTNKAITKPIIDPICHMKVDPSKTDIVVTHQGRSYYFCSEACRKAFEKNPHKCPKPKLTRLKGWWGRYLERVAKANNELFGGGSPRCQCSNRKCQR